MLKIKTKISKLKILVTIVTVLEAGVKNRSKYIPNFFKPSSLNAMSVGEKVLKPVPAIISPESFCQK